MDWKDFKPFLQRLVPDKSTVLLPGCGKSLLGEHVALLGHKVTGFDFEPNCIEVMNKRKSKLAEYEVGDMTKMHYSP